jgi:hypothetical protein
MYEQKFKEFIRACAELPSGGVLVIHHPEVIGDDYDEIVESLNRLADAELLLSVVPRAGRTEGEGS